MTIKGVIFDLDNTVYDELNYLRAVIAKFSELSQLDMSPSLKWLDHSTRANSRNILKDILLESGQYSIANHDVIFELYQSVKAEVKYDDAFLTTVKKLNSRNVQIAILTNGVVAVQKNKVRNLALENVVDVIIYARENGIEYEKPHIDAFKRVLNALKLEPEECLMVGDNMRCDIDGALSAQLQAIYFSKYEASKNNHKLPGVDGINCLSEIVAKV